MKNYDKVMVYLFFSPALEAEAEVETASTGVKDTQVAEAAAAVEPLLSTLTLKKLTMLIRIVTY